MTSTYMKYLTSIKTEITDSSDILLLKLLLI